MRYFYYLDTPLIESFFRQKTKANIKSTKKTISKEKNISPNLSVGLMGILAPNLSINTRLNNNISMEESSAPFIEEMIDSVIIDAHGSVKRSLDDTLEDCITKNQFSLIVGEANIILCYKDQKGTLVSKHDNVEVIGSYDDRFFIDYHDKTKKVLMYISRDKTVDSFSIPPVDTFKNIAGILSKISENEFHIKPLAWWREL